MENTKRINRSNISPEKLKEVKVRWGILNKPTQNALEKFNRILAKAQLRVYREIEENK
ncbi:hypothetical protein [Pelosinus sp. sgz500959]|uniref:hypothetical protein n=1 Tax=Pelosinus sp. sgz500959 TaxID=3242472 RepID=UPI00366F423B